MTLFPADFFVYSMMGGGCGRGAVAAISIRQAGLARVAKDCIPGANMAQAARTAMPNLV